MKLLTKALEAKLPRLGSTEQTPAAQKVAVVKFFFPAGRATWYAVEGAREGNDVTFFGYVVSPLGPDCDEWGYFSLNELAECKVGYLSVERDLWFRPTPMAQLVGALAPTPETP